MQKNSKIYIAGHRGLVGSAIVKNLQSKGYHNLLLRTHVQLDLLDQRAVEEFFKEEKPEFVFLAAAKVGGIVANNTYRADFIYQNLTIQNNIIYNAYKYNVKKLMFLGSTCIYPKNCPQPIKEEYLLTDELEYTNEPYAIAKIAGIKMCESFNIQYNTNFISVMPTNLYGENDNFDLEKSHVLPALIRKIHLGKLLEDNDWEGIEQDLNKNPIENIDGNSDKKQIIEKLNKYGISFGIQNSTFKINSNSVRIEIWGSGKPQREFLYSEDMADACVYLMEKVDIQDILKPNTQHLTHNPHFLNIGTGKDISIKELAYLIKDAVGYKGEFYFNTSKPDGTMRKVTNVSKLHKLGWKHSVELKEGIEKIYEWYQRCVETNGEK